MTNAALRGKPDAGNPHVRFDEGEVASAATPRRGSLLYKFCVTILSCMGLFLACNSCFGGDVVGLWTFDGATGAECIPGSAFENLAADSALTLVADVNDVDYYTQKKAVVHNPTYVADVPGACLYSDNALTNKIGDLTTSIFVSTGATRVVGSYLRIPGLGAELAGTDFTIEFIVKPAVRNTTAGGGYGFGDTAFAALTGDASKNKTAVLMTEYNGGMFATYDGVDGENRGWVSGLYDGKWHHVALSYSASERKVYLTQDMHSSYSLAFKDGGALPIDKDSFFQILGPVPGVPGSLYNATVAAMRVTKRKLSSSEYLRVIDDYSTDSTIAHWRFSGEIGQAVQSVTNEVESSVVIASVSSSVVACKGSPIFGIMPKGKIKFGMQSAKLADNESGAYSGNPSAGASAGVGFRVGPYDALHLPGSFTAEMFFFCASNSACGGTSSGRQLLIGESSNSGAQEIAWAVRTHEDATRNILQLAYKKYDMETGVLSGATYVDLGEFSPSKWHHLAVAYDDGASPRKLHAYLNYSCVATVELGPTERLARSVNGYLYLAGSGELYSPGRWFGAIDEVRFTHACLPEDELLRMTNGGGFSLIFR